MANDCCTLNRSVATPHRTNAWSGLAVTVLLFVVTWASRSSAALDGSETIRMSKTITYNSKNLVATLVMVLVFVSSNVQAQKTRRLEIVDNSNIQISSVMVTFAEEREIFELKFEFKNVSHKSITRITFQLVSEGDSVGSKPSAFEWKLWFTAPLATGKESKDGMDNRIVFSEQVPNLIALFKDQKTKIKVSKILFDDGTVWTEPLKSPPFNNRSACTQQTTERNTLMNEAERNTFTVRRVEFIGLTYTHDQIVRDRMTPFVQEGDIFSRERLIKSFQNMSRLRAINPLQLRDAALRLDRSEKSVDMIVCFKQKASLERIRVSIVRHPTNAWSGLAGQ